MAETTVQNGLATRPVARFVAIGLFLMAFFTLLWALWSVYGLPVAGSIALVVIFSVIAVIFVINGVRLLRPRIGCLSQPATTRTAGAAPCGSDSASLSRPKG